MTVLDAIVIWKKGIAKRNLEALFSIATIIRMLRVWVLVRPAHESMTSSSLLHTPSTLTILEEFWHNAYRL